MQNQNEIAKINYFLCVVSPIIVGHMKMLCQSTGAKVREQGRGLDLSLLIKSGKKKIKFFLHNLFLEIATVDRDDDPQRFDERLHDFEFFLAKMTRIARNKLKILFHLLLEEDVDAAIENIGQDAKQFERVRIWRFDQEKPAQDHQP